MIRIIRKADEPKAELMAEFELTEIQAEDILEIRLRQLARLEGIKIESELKTLKTERKGLKRVLGDAKALSDMIVAEIQADAAKYGDARRTLIEAAASPVLVRTVPDEPVTITLSRNGWIRSRQGHGLDAAQFTYKAGDGPLAVLETRTIHPVVILDTRGRAYTIRASDVPGGRGDGSPVTTHDRAAVGRQGRAGDFRRDRSRISRRRERRLWLHRNARGHGVAPESRQDVHVAWTTTSRRYDPCSSTPGFDHVAALTAKGKLLVFGLDEMRTMERGRGVMMMRLDDDDRLAAVALVTAQRVMLRGISRGKETVVAIEGEELARHRLHRARKGYLLARRFKPEGFA